MIQLKMDFLYRYLIMFKYVQHQTPAQRGIFKLWEYIQDIDFGKVGLGCLCPNWEGAGWQVVVLPFIIEKSP